MTNQNETVERRALLPFEIRQEGDSIKVVGHAAVFDQETDIGGMFREVIRPGAFRNAIRTSDVPFLIEHRDLPLARTRSGTLVLSEDEMGLRIEANLDPSDPDVQRIVPKMRRRDLDKMSFAFRATRQHWDHDNEPALRELEEVELFDVSIVTTPAYQGTDIALRSLEAARSSAAKTKRQDMPCKCGTKRSEARGEQLGALIQRLRDEVGTTNGELGQNAGIDESTVGQIITGSIQCPPRGRLEAMAEVLQVSVDRLISAAESDGCDYGNEENSAFWDAELRAMRQRIDKMERQVRMMRRLPR